MWLQAPIDRGRLISISDWTMVPWVGHKWLDSVLIVSEAVTMNSITWSSSTSLVSRREASCEGLAGDFICDWSRLRLRSRLASLMATCKLSSESTVKLTELLALSMFSHFSDTGSSFSITMGAGGRTWVARLLTLAGMFSLNNSCDHKNLC